LKQHESFAAHSKAIDAQAAGRTLSGEEPAQAAPPPVVQAATDSAADSANEVELARDVDVPADAGADAPATEDADGAFQLLDGALQGLQVCLQKHSRITMS
jgi:hypothetical protein